MLVPTGHALYARERASDEHEGYRSSAASTPKVWDLRQ
jgi:hypothetical protein